MLKTMSGGPSPAAPSAVVSPDEEGQGTSLVSVLYSKGGDLYQVPSMGKAAWLSVQVYPLPAQMPANQMATADGKAWRKAYSTAWRAIEPGRFATLPADDPMVADYAAFSGSPL